MLKLITDIEKAKIASKEYFGRFTSVERPSTRTVPGWRITFPGNKTIKFLHLDIIKVGDPLIVFDTENTRIGFKSLGANEYIMVIAEKK